MPKPDSPKNALQLADLEGLTRIVQDAVLQTSHLAEDLQRHIVHPPFLPSTPFQHLVSGVSAGVHRVLRSSARWSGDAAIRWLQHPERESPAGVTLPYRGEVLAALNGLAGDYLERSGNPLTQPMQLHYQGQPIAAGNARDLLAREPRSGKILLMVHGLCMNDQGWTREDHNHGEALADAFQMTPLYLTYNSGLHVSQNGERLSEALEGLLRAWPVTVQELVIVAHSMGGLVSRSAVHLAQQQQKGWVQPLRKMMFLGTPHHGTSLEKIGNHVQSLLRMLRYARPLLRIARLRSAGITDLRFGNLLEADWQSAGRFARNVDQRQPVPLPQGVQTYSLAAVLGKSEKDIKSYVVGDGLVPLGSALGQHAHPAQRLAFSESHILLQTSHMDLLSRDTAYAVLREWMMA
jgi:pimeloyl-ACP methyl ester carboxylesterase